MRRTDDVSLWPWLLTLEVTAIVGHTRLGTLSEYQVQFSSVAHKGSDIPCNLVTLTFNLGGHGACRWCGSTSPFTHQLWSSYALLFGRYGTCCMFALVGLWPWSMTFDLETNAQCSTCHGVLYCQFYRLFVFDLWVNTA